VVQQAVAPSGSGTLVVDGIRHLGAVEALSRIAGPDATVVVFVDAPWEARAARLAARGVDVDEARAADEHSNEAEVGAVMTRADTLVVNDRNLEEAVSATLDALRAIGIHSSVA
jgi:dephospho-CoA kinase